MNKMKNHQIILLLTSVFLLASACQKRDRLLTDTLVVGIEPSSPQVLLVGGTLSLKSLARSPKSENVAIKPKWTVTNNLGTFSVAEGAETVFTADPALAGTGKIKATYGTVTAELDLTISATLTSNVFGFYSETYVAPNYSALKYDTANPGDVKGGCMGAWGGATLSAGTGAGESTEGAQGLKCTIGGAAGGWWIQFGSDNTAGFAGDTQVATDMSAFTGGNIKFDVKTTKEISIKLEWTGGNKELKLITDLGIPADGAWHSVTIPLSSFTGVDLTKIKIPAGFHSLTNTGYVYYIDNVRWEK